MPVANKRDTRSIEEAMNEIRAKKRLKQEDDSGAHSSSSWVASIFFASRLLLCVCIRVCVYVCVYVCAEGICVYHLEDVDGPAGDGSWPSVAASLKISVKLECVKNTAYQQSNLRVCVLVRVCAFVCGCDTEKKSKGERVFICVCEMWSKSMHRKRLQTRWTIICSAAFTIRCKGLKMPALLEAL